MCFDSQMRVYRFTNGYAILPTKASLADYPQTQYFPGSNHAIAKSCHVMSVII